MAQASSIFFTRFKSRNAKVFHHQVIVVSKVEQFGCFKIKSDIKNDSMIKILFFAPCDP